MKTRIIYTLIAAVATVSSHAAVAPRLVVGIIVEGLSTADVEAERMSFGLGGFNRLLNSGAVVEDVEYGNASSDAALALVMTGAKPSLNGIDGSTRFDFDDRKSRSIVYDKAFIGNFTSETYSPASLLVSTITDELKAATDGRASVHSIAPSAEGAIIAGGHAASSATWINDTDGRWSTSTYYRYLPSLVSDANYRTPLSQRLDTISYAGNGYTYRFPKNDADRYAKFKSSPRVNEEITTLACEYLKWMSRNTSSTSTTDMLTLVYTVTPYPFGTSSSTLLQEQTDAYRSLDGQLSRLFTTIDRTAGLQNTLVYVIGVPAEDYSRPAEVRYSIPGGEFSPRRARGLLNMYLMALHGNGEWVSGYDNGRVYLNRALAEEKKVDIAVLRREAAEFLARMSGVAQAVTCDEVLSSPSMRDYVNAKTIADIFVSVAPGWTLVETGNPRTEGKTVHLSAHASPLYILSPQVKHQTISSQVEAAAIAPTLSRLIRIRAPNGASSRALPLMRQ